ncbi:RNA polymerase sigma-70 factor (ECF subfamily) [Prauserella sediminis]|uniref:RNA polymerase sigma-70 factor (ECF subfamily) n=1 Tax=Prauserella sediminis TaxID=577680 RepID=A0A839XFW5_9PSEU|nr:sigma-70 family RNA polymerase sigma factor [Prauserella sediminis]MBB3661651.1 RNA polymerase sigma-70 factor (ECF subfamily) [Prauserella sediminis]
MERSEWLAERFEEHRPRLRAVAYRMLGSLAEAEDAVQDAWLRLSRAETDDIDNLGGWLTTVVGRECLHVLRSRRRRREDLVAPVGTPLPDPVVFAADEDADPEREALIADSVSLALLVVLDSLGPAERLAFVLHDMFDLPFDEIAPLVGRTPVAARQLASRARRRVHGSEPPIAGSDHIRQREIVDAFYAAANSGDFSALVAVLDPDVVFRADYGSGRAPAVYRGAATVAKQARRARGADLHRVLVNSLPGVVTSRRGRPVSIMAFTVVEGRIVEIDGIRDPDRVQRLAGHLVRPGR